MTHILVRSECRENEKRVGITPLEAEHLLKKGIKVSIETVTHELSLVQNIVT